MADTARSPAGRLSLAPQLTQVPPCWEEITMLSPRRCGTHTRRQAASQLISLPSVVEAKTSCPPPPPLPGAHPRSGAARARGASQAEPARHPGMVGAATMMAPAATSAPMMTRAAAAARCSPPPRDDPLRQAAEPGGRAAKPGA